MTLMDQNISSNHPTTVFAPLPNKKTNAFVKVKIINSQINFKVFRVSCLVCLEVPCPSHPSAPRTVRLRNVRVVPSKRDGTDPPVVLRWPKRHKKAGEMAPSSCINYALRDRSITLRQTPRTCPADGRRRSIAESRWAAVGPYGYVCTGITAWVEGTADFVRKIIRLDRDTYVRFIFDRSNRVSVNDDDDPTT